MEKEEIYQILNKAYFSEDCDEKEVLDQLASIMTKVKCFIDVGASLGQYTHFANRHMVGGDIYTIEADPVRFEELERNCSRWMNESTNRLHPIHAAVSDTDGTVKFYTTESNVSGGLFIHPVKSAGVEWHEIEVDSITLDKYFSNKTPELIKMDIEGGELRALRGAKNFLAQKKASFFIEVHSWADPEGQKDQYEVYDFMQNAGYEKKSIKGKLFFSPAAAQKPQEDVSIVSHGIREMFDRVKRLF